LCPPRLKLNDKHRQFFTKLKKGECINVNDWPNDSNELVDILKNKIKQISTKLATTNNACYNKRKHFKKPWFDWDCETTRSQSFKLLNLYRKTKSEIIDSFYVQKSGLPMGSPLSPLMADIFLDELENRIFIVSKFKNNIHFWYRYVDDVVCLWTGSRRQLNMFLNEINELNKSIQFTMEKKKLQTP
jgi:hypothetical protein